jgi:hypothetical protein
MLREILQEIGINIGISVAGLFGSLLLIGKSATTNLRATFFSIVSGVASANYITPVVVDIANIDPDYDMSIAFILGFLGLKGVELVTNKFLNKTGNGSINQRNM